MPCTLAAYMARSAARQQVLERRAVERVQRRPDAGRQLVTLDGRGGGDGPGDHRRPLGDGTGIDDAGHQDDELVASPSPDEVRVAHRVTEGAGSSNERTVAGLVADRVVDGLELVEVDDHETRPGAVAAEPPEHLCRPALELGAVRQPGEGVGRRPPLQRPVVGEHPAEGEHGERRTDDELGADQPALLGGQPRRRRHRRAHRPRPVLELHHRRHGVRPVAPDRAGRAAAVHRPPARGRRRLPPAGRRRRAWCWRGGGGPPGRWRRRPRRRASRREWRRPRQDGRRRSPLPAPPGHRRRARWWPMGRSTRRRRRGRRGASAPRPVGARRRRPAPR